MLKDGPCVCFKTQFVHFVVDSNYTQILLLLYIKGKYTPKKGLQELLTQISHLIQRIFITMSFKNQYFTSGIKYEELFME